MKETVRNIIALLLPKEKKRLLLHIGFDIAVSLLDIAFFIKRHMGLLRYQTKTASEKSLQHLNEALAGYIERHKYNQKDFLLKDKSNSKKS